MQSIPPFSLPELETALQGIANLRSADAENIVVEMMQHANVPFKELLMTFLNQALIYRYYNESWHVAVLQMIPKDGDLGGLANWRHIALLIILYEVFS